MTNYFITANYLKENGYVNKNVDELLYVTYIPGIAKAFIKHQIGTYFFNALLVKYNAQTLTNDEIIVVDLMQQAISWRLKSELAIESSIQLTNKGLLYQSDDNAVPADLKTIQFRTEALISRAIQFELELAEWLTENKDLYADFMSSSNKDSKIKNKCCKGGSNYADGQNIIIV